MSKQFGVIYLLTNQVNGKQYVGQTVDINKRMGEHRRESTQVVDKAINKYGWENFSVNVLEDTVPQNKLDSKEREYIKEYNTFKGRGYNCTEGGEGYKITPEIRLKISETKKNRSEEISEIMSEALKGREITREWRENLSEALKGQNAGENNPRNKFTKSEGLAIKENYENNAEKSMKDVAKEHGICAQTVCNIVNNNHWSTRDQ